MPESMFEDMPWEYCTDDKGLKKLHEILKEIDPQYKDSDICEMFQGTEDNAVDYLIDMIHERIIK